MQHSRKHNYEIRKSICTIAMQGIDDPKEFVKQANEMKAILTDLLQCEWYIKENLPEGLVTTQVMSILEKAKQTIK